MRAANGTKSERKRAQKSRPLFFKQDKKSFIVRRAVLRTILGRYLQINPKHVQVSSGPHGKPYLADKHGDSAIRFNLTHSNELTLYAFTRSRNIGIDLEYCRILQDVEQIAARFFSVRENDTIQTISKSQRQQAFYNSWIRKEAYIKAIGKGLAQPLDRFEVSLAPGEPASLKSVEGVPEEATRWSIKALAP